MKNNLTINAFNEAENQAFLVGAVKIGFCSECEKPNVFCKGMCQACYSKMLRNTEKGKERMKAYNISAGKEAQIKYRERKKANKPPKPLKQNCECGKPSVSKNLCINCYQRFYQRKKKGYKEGARKTKVDKEMLYNNVLSFVKKGYTILNACKKAGYNSSCNLYRTITPIQKAELNAYKILRDADDDDF